MVAKPREWLVSARKAKGLTQDKMAEMLRITRTTYLRYENGERTPRPEIASKIEEIVGVKKELFFWA